MKNFLSRRLTYEELFHGKFKPSKNSFATDILQFLKCSEVFVGLFGFLGKFVQLLIFQVNANKTSAPINFPKCGSKSRAEKFYCWRRWKLKVLHRSGGCFNSKSGWSICFQICNYFSKTSELLKRFKISNSRSWQIFWTPNFRGGNFPNSSNFRNFPNLANSEFSEIFQVF